ncbi:MAG: DUF4900 domain-containing protein [Ignavibacteriales bacterium]|nr:DUF4900 domain-containing protein [Ignavibacteriales bacterium]
MNGKVSLFLVMGFSALFAIFGRNMLSNSTVSINNYSYYFNKTQASQIAKSGVFYAIAQLNNINPNWTGGSLDFANGDANVSVQVVGGSNGVRIVTSEGNYGGGHYLGTETFVVTLRQRSLSEYGNFYNKFAIASGGSVWAATGDVFDGKFHANDFVRCYGDPVFKGAVTSTRTIQRYDANSHPVFEEGYRENVAEITHEIDIAEITAGSVNGKVFYDTTGANKFTDVYLKFYANGTVDYKLKIGSGAWTPIKNTLVTALTDNGLIHVKGGRVSVEGVLDGQVTVVATKSGVASADAGKVIIPNSITYAGDVLSDYGKTQPPFVCNDMLGLVAEKEVIVPFNNARGDINIHASIFAEDGGMKIESYSSYSGVNNMNIVGGVIGNYVEPTADYAWNNILKQYVPIKGYSYVHKFDTRFESWAPPFFPKTRRFIPELWYTEEEVIPEMNL